jgi:hypothetical protein
MPAPSRRRGRKRGPSFSNPTSTDAVAFVEAFVGAATGVTLVNGWVLQLKKGGHYDDAVGGQLLDSGLA